MFEENEISKNAQGGTEIAKRMLSKVLDPELLSNFQIISSRVRELDPTKIRIFWAHDLAPDPEVAGFKNENFRNKFHHMTFISNWQYQQYQLILGVPYSQNHSVIESGIDIVNPNPNKFPADVLNICYTSTPQRGLAILIPVFEELQKKFGDKIHLHVFSSFKIYGWDEMDQKFEPLYQKCRENPGITYYGFQPHDVVLNHLSEVGHIFAYPCIWPETSCRAMLEAMSSKMLCVHPNFAALHDTSGALNVMYQGDIDHQTHANIFAGMLDQAINLTKDEKFDLNGRLNFNKAYIDSRFGMPKVKYQWEMLLQGLLKKYPTPESRKLASDMFIYRS